MNKSDLPNLVSYDTKSRSLTFAWDAPVGGEGPVPDLDGEQGLMRPEKVNYQESATNGEVPGRRVIISGTRIHRSRKTPLEGKAYYTYTNDELADLPVWALMLLSDVLDGGM